MKKVIDLTGQRFGRLTVFKFYEINNDRCATWECSCDCGAKVIVNGTHLRNGNTRSCGCLQSDISASRLLVHGMKGTREYNSWRSMMKRCNNPNDKAYNHYGGRGISVCERWRKFENFYADMGGRPDGYSLDRINNNGNYEPSNCQWSTQKEQANNRRNRHTAKI